VTQSRTSLLAAVALSVTDLESLEETLERLANQPLLAQIRKSTAESAAGRGTVLSKEQALDLLHGT
jgi:PHD/YefM family antitoxin component YafN of YafNO toxin-antitoxin module